MPALLEERTLYESEIVAIMDVRCEVHDDCLSDEELTAAPELVFPRTGLFVRLVGRTRVLGDANHVLFFDAGEIHRVSHPLGCGDATTVLRFRASVLADAFPRAASRAPRFPLTHCAIGGEVSLALHALRRRLLSSGTGSPSGNDEIDGCALDVLQVVQRRVQSRVGRPERARREPTRRSRVDTVEHTRLLLGRTYHEARPLLSIARAVGASPFHLSRLFREEVGLPIHRYRTLLRLGEALERLADGESDLARLAGDLGFASHAHFTGTFRARFGLSPSSYRRSPSAIPLRQLRKILKAPSPRCSVV